jgi:hypothetical protein
LKKITVLVDIYYLKAAVAGIGSYIRELELHLVIMDQMILTMYFHTILIS